VLVSITGSGFGAVTFRVCVETMGNGADATTGRGLTAFTVIVLVSVTDSGFGAATFMV
jgi:hypothetical protein